MDIYLRIQVDQAAGLVTANGRGWSLVVQAINEVMNGLYLLEQEREGVFRVGVDYANEFLTKAARLRLVIDQNGLEQSLKFASEEYIKVAITKPFAHDVIRCLMFLADCACLANEEFHSRLGCDRAFIRESLIDQDLFQMRVDDSF